MIQSHNQGEALRRSEARYHQMVDEVEDYAILTLDLDGIIKNWNKGAEKIKGYKPEEIIGKNFRIFYTKEDRNARLPDQLLREAIKNGRVTHEGWRVRKDGTNFWGNVVITALHDENKNVVGFLKVTRDLTERKEAEERQNYDRLQLVKSNEDLRRSEERYHKMMEEVADYAILVLDMEGNVRNWNKGVEKIKGYTREEIIGKNFRIFYTKEDRERGLPDQLLAEAMKSGRVSRRMAGTKRWNPFLGKCCHYCSSR